MQIDIIPWAGGTRELLRCERETCYEAIFQSPLARSFVRARNEEVTYNRGASMGGRASTLFTAIVGKALGLFPGTMTFAKWLQSLKNVEKGELLFFSPTSLGTYLSNTKPGNWWVRSFCPWICICFPLSLPRQRRAEGRNQHNFHWPGSKYAYDILLTFTLPDWAFVAGYIKFPVGVLPFMQHASCSPHEWFTNEGAICELQPH